LVVAASQVLPRGVKVGALEDDLGEKMLYKFLGEGLGLVMSIIPSSATPVSAPAKTGSVRVAAVGKAASAIPDSEGSKVP